MKSSQCTAPGQPSASRGRDGRLWFATTRGWQASTRLRPARRPALRRSSSRRSSSTGSPWRSRRSWRPRRGPRESRSASRGCRRSGRNRTAVRFRLEGYEDAWVEAGDRRRAEYTQRRRRQLHLPDRRAGRKGEWSEAGAGLSSPRPPAPLPDLAFRPRRRRRRDRPPRCGTPAPGPALASRERELSRLVEERTAELKSQGSYLASLHETALAIMDRLEPQQLLQPLVETGRALLGAPYGFLYLETADGARLERRVWVGTQPRDEFVLPGEGAGRTDVGERHGRRDRRLRRLDREGPERPRRASTGLS